MANHEDHALFSRILTPGKLELCIRTFSGVATPQNEVTIEYYSRHWEQNKSQVATTVNSLVFRKICTSALGVLLCRVILFGLPLIPSIKCQEWCSDGYTWYTVKTHGDLHFGIAAREVIGILMGVTGFTI